MREKMSTNDRENREGMTAQREARILEGAIYKWGPALQTDVAIEEMAELTQAIIKLRRTAAELRTVDEELSGDAPEGLQLARKRLREALEDARRSALARLREEMADVSIMLRQLELIYGGYADEELRKLERLERLLGEVRHETP